LLLRLWGGRQVAEGWNRLAELIKVALAAQAIRQMINQATFGDRIDGSISGRR
jgi:hypothetical protein